MSIAAGFALLHAAAYFRQTALACRRDGLPTEAERYKRKARDHLRLAPWQPPPNLPDRKADHDQG